MELHPDFPTTPFVYLYYTSTTGGDGGPWLDNRLSRFTWNGSALGSEVVLKTFASAGDGMAAAANHQAGPILFGPDNLLYGTTGDLTRDFAEQNNQSQAGVSSLMGGIYRLNADGSIPPTNPFASNPNSNFHAWFAYGVRNTYGIAFDPLTGNLWDTENGAGNYDEINLVSAGTNSGWNEIMGPVARDSGGTSTLVQLPGSFYNDPEFSWLATVAPTGLVFLANSQFDAGYRDALLVGDAKDGNLYLFRLDAGRTGFVLTGGLSDLVADDLTEQNQLRFGQNFGLVTDMQVGPDGAVYVTGHDRGTVYRLPEPSFAIAMLAGSLAVAVAGRARGIRSRPRERKSTTPRSSAPILEHPFGIAAR
jgi:glucose/arabinose dehydrogenase